MDQTLAPKNRAELVDRLDVLRSQGIVSPEEEASLLQHFDEMLRDVEIEKAALEREFQRRIDADGETAARDWLAESAKELGRRHGEATRSLTTRLQVVSGGPG